MVTSMPVHVHGLSTWDSTIHITLLRVILLSAVRNINFTSVDRLYGPPVQSPLIACTHATELKAKHNVIKLCIYVKHNLKSGDSCTAILNNTISLAVF